MSGFKCFYRLRRLLLPASIFLLSYSNQKPRAAEDDAVAVVHAYFNAVAAMDARAIQGFIADSMVLVSAGGNSRFYNRKLTYPICEWEKGMNTKWSHEILGVDSNVVTVLSTEKSDYYRYLGLGSGIQIAELHIENGKIKKDVSKLIVTANSNQHREYQRFKKWLLSQNHISEPDLISADGGLAFDGKSAPRMLYWLKRWATYPGNRNEKASAEAMDVVKKHCQAVKEMDAPAIRRYYADHYVFVSANGRSRTVDSMATRKLCEWEKGMHTQWSHRVLAADSNAVTVLSTENSDYYRYLDLGQGVQAETYYVENGKITKSVSNLFLASQHDQSKAYQGFKKWLPGQPNISEPDLISPDGGLIFDGKSAPRMLYWLKKWAEYSGR